MAFLLVAGDFLSILREIVQFKEELTHFYENKIPFDKIKLFNSTTMTILDRILIGVGALSWLSAIIGIALALFDFLTDINFYMFN